MGIELYYLDLIVLKYYKDGGQLCGFEPDRPYKNLVKLGFLDWDLELTPKGLDFIKKYNDWGFVTAYNNETVIVIKP